MRLKPTPPRRSSALCAALLFLAMQGAVAGAADPANESVASAASRPSTGAGAGAGDQDRDLVFIDFETFPDGSPVPDDAEIVHQYESLGVIFNSQDCADGASQISTILDNITTKSPPNSLAPCGPAPYNGGTLVLLFEPPVLYMVAWCIDDQFDVIVTAFDANDAIVDSDSSDGANQGFDKIRVAHSGGIARVEMAGGFFGEEFPDGWAIDDLEFLQQDITPSEASSWGRIKASYR